ncbi:MAG: metallophosphoesterase [Clostridia bacterium]|nr:metallophosphoesterase [Clostridia bacterium]
MHLITKLAIGVGTLIAVKGLDNRLEVTYYEPRLENLPPELDGFKIAHISDLHSESIPGLGAEIAALAPDMIAVTGDMIHDDDRSYEPVMRLFERLVQIAPVYMISGNHDLWNTSFTDFVEYTDKLGVHFIDDTMCEIEHNGAKFGLFGMRDPFGKATDIIEKSLAKSFAKLPEYDGFRMLLFHRANQFTRLTGHGFDLILSGHMHGGQFRIPGVGGVMPPKSSLIDSKQIVFPRYTEGTYTDGSTTMIVNRGIGNPMFIPRLYNRPEIGIVTLKAVDRQ